MTASTASTGTGLGSLQRRRIRLRPTRTRSAASTLFAVVAVAAQARRDTGTTPGWLEPIWAAANWFEAVYIVLTSLAYIVLGIGMLRAGFPATWVGWASVAIGAVSVVGMVASTARFGFPQLPLLVSVAVGFALITS